ncbi:RNA polymerase subunit beta [Alphaproteobacteria bacterium]
MSLTISSYTSKKRIRQSFGRILDTARIPNLIHIQKKSYEDFLQLGKKPEERERKGLESILYSIFPISDYDNKATIEYVKYNLGDPKYDIQESMQRGVNYAAPLTVTLRLIIWDAAENGEVCEIKSIKEQDVYMGEVPLMTESGTFIINGAQRVIVSQMHRSPGVFYFHDSGKNNTAGKYLYFARIIPYRGVWLDLEFDSKDLIFFRVDRRRKLYITTLLRALGYDRDSILNEFYAKKTYYRRDGKWVTKFNIEDFKGLKLIKDVVDYETGEPLISKGARVTPKLIKEFADSNKFYVVNEEDIVGSFVAVSLKDGVEEVIEAGSEITPSTLNYIGDTLQADEIQVLDIDNVKVGPYVRNTLALDKNTTREEALFDIYRVLRPGDPPTPETAEKLLHSVFFDPEKYSLSAVGRMKINIKHELDVPEDFTCLRIEDIVAFIKHLVGLKDGYGEIDDIDSLSNRRVRSVGELIENQFRLGLSRIERSILERMNMVELDSIMLHDLVNSKVLMAIINEFFGTSQLSQFMDQTNPVAEITHKRRVSALGPGGLTRERAGFAVRDVHNTHYGRICPIETPEGQNIGLISSLATYARINKYGFIETPCRKVVDGRVTEEIFYLSAIEEGKYTIAQASAEIGADGELLGEVMNCRCKGEFTVASPKEISYIDVSPKQLVSVAASLIPFLENDDASRALMGSNMQRQAVPLVKSEAPLVGTGMEAIVARDSEAVVIAKRGGMVEQVDATRIVIRCQDSNEPLGVDIYTLTKYQKSNKCTCINQKPIVKVGDVIQEGDIIADGSCTDLGELALGKNVLVAFMPWNGYNFEDSILISERLVREDVYTSIHISEYQVIARDTRLGPEDITRDVPNVPEENLRQLDENGIVHIGASVKSGDILVGKVTPKTESPLTSEEKLLQAIFGEKASDVRDSSLRVPPGERGTVIGVRVFTRRGVEKNERAIALERVEIGKLSKNANDQLVIIESFVYDKLAILLAEQRSTNKIKNYPAGTVLSKDVLGGLPNRSWWQLEVEDQSVTERILQLKSFYEATRNELNTTLQNKIARLQSGDDLPQGALKVVNVYVATKLKLQPGDKIAGRHGNKGVVSRIAPIEDMPFLPDGTAVDIVLNPLGVPSRMNVGQILETHLGWASANIGKQLATLLQSIESQQTGATLENLRASLLEIYNRSSYSDKEARELIQGMNCDELLELGHNLKKGVPVATPVFDGAKEGDINDMLKKANIATSGQADLIDGRTGEYFDRKVTVGYIYMMKLDHLVDNKIHARSIGPYSLVTQQPLGGKSHFGGQRLGEMECWALQAYGAAHTLLEMLTVKSDDVSGRIKVYESIVRGDYAFAGGIPESFKVMVKELRSLGLNIDLVTDSDEQLEEMQEEK